MLPIGELSVPPKSGRGGSGFRGFGYVFDPFAIFLKLVECGGESRAVVAACDEEKYEEEHGMECGEEERHDGP